MDQEKCCTHFLTISSLLYSNSISEKNLLGNMQTQVCLAMSVSGKCLLCKNLVETASDCTTYSKRTISCQVDKHFKRKDLMEQQDIHTLYYSMMY